MGVEDRRAFLDAFQTPAVLMVVLMVLVYLKAWRPAFSLRERLEAPFPRILITSPKSDLYVSPLLSS